MGSDIKVVPKPVVILTVPFNLVVVHPFNGHDKGDLITDYDEINTILNSDHIDRVNKISKEA